jgi:16S rRNA (uracil1498-N3)-methyltransferase
MGSSEFDVGCWLLVVGCWLFWEKGSVHRFHLPPELCRAAEFSLSESDAHHATKVLRLREGDAVTVLDGAGGIIEGTIRSAGKREVVVGVRHRTQAPEPAFRLHLIQAIPKAKLMESIIQKATELGVARVVPLLADRVVTHLDGEGAEAKAAKWQQVAIEAIKQCGQPWLPKVEPPMTPTDWLKRNENAELCLVGALRPGSRHPKAFFEEFARRHGRRPKDVAIWIGPEGDFTPAELDAAEAAGARPITLGPLVLRVETASIYCLSVANYEMRAE